MSDLTFTVTGPDGDETDLTLPEALVDALSEPDEDPSHVVSEIALMAFTQRAHAVVHHSEDEVPDHLVEAEERARELFEEQFGVTFGEATGHQH